MTPERIGTWFSSHEADELLTGVDSWGVTLFEGQPAIRLRFLSSNPVTKPKNVLIDGESVPVIINLGFQLPHALSALEKLQKQLTLLWKKLRTIIKEKFDFS